MNYSFILCGDHSTEFWAPSWIIVICIFFYKNLFWYFGIFWQHFFFLCDDHKHQILSAFMNYSDLYIFFIKFILVYFISIIYIYIYWRAKKKILNVEKRRGGRQKNHRFFLKKSKRFFKTFRTFFQNLILKITKCLFFGPTVCICICIYIPTENTMFDKI